MSLGKESISYRISPIMVQLHSANLTDTFQKDGKCYVILEISRKTCIKWLYKSMKHDVTYSLQDMNNFLNSLFLIKKKNIKKKNRNKFTKIAPSEAEEEIDLNNSTSSIQYVEDVENNLLDHFESCEDTLPDVDEVVNLNSSTSSIQCIESGEDKLSDGDEVLNLNPSTSSIEYIEDTSPKDEIIDLTTDDLNAITTNAKDEVKYKKPKRMLKQKQPSLLENCSTIFQWKNRQVWTKTSTKKILSIASESSTKWTHTQFGWQSTSNINILNMK